MKKTKPSSNEKSATEREAGSLMNSKMQNKANSKIEMEKETGTGKTTGEAQGQLNAELARRVAEQSAEIRNSYKAIEAERQRFKDVLETLPAYVCLLTPDYQMPFANRIFREWFGYQPDKKCYEFLFDRNEPCENCDTYKVLDTKKPHRWEWTGPNGRNYDIFDFPFKDTDGSQLILEMGMDITERKQALKAVRQGEERYRSLIEATTQIVWTTDSQGQVISDMPLWREFTGQSIDEIQGWGWINSLNPDDREQTARIWKKAIQDKTLYETEYRIRRKDGEYRYVSVRGVPVLEQDGSIREWVGTCTDITEQKRAQEALRSASLYSRSLIETSLDPLVTISAAGKITDVNEATIKVTGLPRQELIGTDFSNYFTEPDKAREGYQLVFSHGTVTDYPLTIRHKNGKLTDVLYNASVYNDDRGNVLGVFAAARDVTEQKRAQEELGRHREHLEELVEERTVELRQSEQSLARAQEIAHLGSWELDLVKDKLTWSDEVYRIFGLKPQEFGATYEAFLKHVHPDDRKAVDTAYSKSVRDGEDFYEIEHRVIRADSGEIRFVHEKCEHFRNEAGKIVRSVGMVHDITERKQYEQQLKRSNENLEQFAYVASHDLQEPLRVMASYSQLLERRYKEKLGQDANDFIGFIVDAAGRMQTLITDLLTYSRAGRQNLTLSRVDCNEVMRKVTSSLSKVIETDNAVITWDELPVLSGAEVSFTQLFQNLVGNAIKFKGPKPPEIKIAARQVNNQWLFSFSDNGIGIESQYQERIFQIFQRLHSRNEYAGTGIGLSICKKIVENWGGRIWVESRPGEGSVFYFTVPIERRISD